MKPSKTTRKVMMAGLVILVANAPLAILSKFGSQGDRIAGVIFGIGATLIVLPLFFEFVTREDDKDKTE